MGDNCYNLTHLKEGQSGIVTEITTSGDMRRRFLDLGIIEGTCIKCIQKSPYGDPTAYKIRGALIALRKDDSETIHIDFK